MTVRGGGALTRRIGWNRWARAGVQSYQGGWNRDAFVKGVELLAEAFFLRGSGPLMQTVRVGMSLEY